MILEVLFDRRKRRPSHDDGFEDERLKCGGFYGCSGRRSGEKDQLGRQNQGGLFV